MPKGFKASRPLTGEEVREARETLGLTQQQLADVLELESQFSRDTVREWEAGRRQVTGPAGVAIRLLLQLHQMEARKALAE